MVTVLIGVIMYNWLCILTSRVTQQCFSYLNYVFINATIIYYYYSFFKVKQYFQVYYKVFLPSILIKKKIWEKITQMY